MRVILDINPAQCNLNSTFWPNGWLASAISTIRVNSMSSLTKDISLARFLKLEKTIEEKNKNKGHVLQHPRLATIVTLGTRHPLQTRSFVRCPRPDLAARNPSQRHNFGLRAPSIRPCKRNKRNAVSSSSSTLSIHPTKTRNRRGRLLSEPRRSSATRIILGTITGFGGNYLNKERLRCYNELLQRWTSVFFI